ncbi:hypothetical protein CJF32_00001970 [Rutstroemia sp. NJR-2017a WRK4]|nr:hypothetical protein CJF32_00001970 [Rutstroemia sp. NJR-2017a WRK4]
MSIPVWWGAPAKELQGIPLDELIIIRRTTPILESLAKQKPSAARELQLFLQDNQEDSHNSADCNLPASSCGSIQATFPRFCDLPGEVRTMIWNYALPGSRVVDIIYDKDQDRYLSFNSPPPALLHACSESRQIASGVYNLCFATESHAANIYLRYDRDILYFVDWLSGYKHRSKGWFEHVTIGPLGKKGLGREELHSIRRVAINSCFIDRARTQCGGDGLWYLHRSVLPVLTRFKALEETFIVLEDIDPYDRQEISFFSIPDHSLVNVALHMKDFPRGEEIEEELGKGLSGNPNEHDAPKVIVVGSARGRKISHTSSFPFCPCESEGMTFNNFGPCYDYDPDVLRRVRVAASIPDQMEEDSDDQAPETSEKIVIESSEVDDLIRDEDGYRRFVANACEGKYGVKHEEWLGIDYFRWRSSL